MQRVRVLAWVALLAGCGTAPVNSLAPDTYALPVDQVFAKLSTDRLRDAVNAWQCGVPVAIEVEGAPNDAVVWRVLSGGSTQLTLTATLTPLNRSTTKVTLAADDGVNGDKSYNGHQFYPRPVLQQPVLALLREQVNAVLGDRPFDIMNVVEIAHDAPGEVGGVSSNGVCQIQRGGREGGTVFSVYDDAGKDADDTRRDRDASDSLQRSEASRLTRSVGQPTTGRPMAYPR